MRRLLEAAAAVLLVPVLAAPASAASERMYLDCGDGRKIERTNGSSWWGVDHLAGYVSEHLLITEGSSLIHEKDYGTRAQGERTTCQAEHFEWTWTVTLVQTR